MKSMKCRSKPAPPYRDRVGRMVEGLLRSGRGALDRPIEGLLRTVDSVMERTGRKPAKHIPERELTSRSA